MGIDRRFALKSGVGLMALTGLVFAAYPFVMSLFPNIKQFNDAWAACDLSHLAEGELKRCGIASVYRRTAKEKSSIDNFTHLLADAESNQSRQPDEAKNRWRSTNPGYFVFLAYAPQRHCSVKLMAAGPELGYYWKPPEQKALMTLPYFTEFCESRTWDASGRLYYRGGYPAEQNLIVPKVRWVSGSKVQIYQRLY